MRFVLQGGEHVSHILRVGVLRAHEGVDEVVVLSGDEFHPEVEFHVLLSALVEHLRFDEPGRLLPHRGGLPSHPSVDPQCL